MSLLDGMKDAMINPLFDSVMEADMDDALDFEFALEAAVDKSIELSDSDIAAILDDDNPDNIAADLSIKDEKLNKIEQDAADDALEAALAELMAFEQDESELPDEDDPQDDPDAASESDEGEADDDVSLDALLDSIF